MDDTDNVTFNWCGAIPAHHRILLPDINVPRPIFRKESGSTDILTSKRTRIQPASLIAFNNEY